MFCAMRRGGGGVCARAIDKRREEAGVDCTLAISSMLQIDNAGLTASKWLLTTVHRFVQLCV